jgi:hypothetical protein
MTSKFGYKKRTREQFLRVLREDQFDDDINRAYRGDTGPLCDYLKNSDLPLKDEHREKLADLIYRHIQRKQRGRPRGSSPVPNPAREAERLIVYGVRQSKLRMFGNKKVPRGKLPELIRQEIKDNAERFEAEGMGRISITNIRNELRRGARRKAK